VVEKKRGGWIVDGWRVGCSENFSVTQYEQNAYFQLNLTQFSVIG
jgi:hypothetical protein